jgi:hypothetical protein
VTPPRLKPLVQANKDLLLRAINLREIPRRTESFRQQLRIWTESGQADDVVPTLVVPNAPEPEVGHCVSCGAAVSRGVWRCDTCSVAVLDALSEGQSVARGPVRCDGERDAEQAGY